MLVLNISIQDTCDTEIYSHLTDKLTVYLGLYEPVVKLVLIYYYDFYIMVVELFVAIAYV